MAVNAARIQDFWREREREPRTSRMPYFYDNCIFQHIWRELCREACLRETEYHRIRHQHTLYLTSLLLDCLLAHRFDLASWSMVGLCGSLTRKIPELLWKAGCEVMMNIPGSHSHLVQFYKSMFLICKPLREQVLLDFALYLVSHKQELTEGYQLLNEKFGKPPFSNNPLIKGYLGLFEYTMWKRNKVKLQVRLGEEIGGHADSWDTIADNSQDVIERQLNVHGKRALSFFEGLVKWDGVWDVFITKQVELLQYYDNNDEARRLLKIYKEKNPDNPNAHRYWYNFMKSEGADKKKLCQILESLVLLDPSSELTQEYAKLKQQLGAKAGGVLRVLFKKLDHSACRGSKDDWEALAQHLKGLPLGTSDHELSKLHECWDERSEWWPRYHFRIDLVPDKNQATSSEWGVALYKAEVAGVLLGKDNPFSKAVRRQDKSIQCQEKSNKHNRNKTDIISESPAKSSTRKRAGLRAPVSKELTKKSRKK